MRARSPSSSYGTKHGKETSKALSDAKDRERAARDLAEKRKDFGTESLDFDPRQWRR